MAYHRVLNIVLCAIQQDLVIHPQTLTFENPTSLSTPPQGPPPEKTLAVVLAAELGLGGCVGQASTPPGTSAKQAFVYFRCEQKRRLSS